MSVDGTLNIQFDRILTTGVSTLPTQHQTVDRQIERLAFIGDGTHSSFRDNSWERNKGRVKVNLHSPVSQDCDQHKLFLLSVCIFFFLLASM